MSATELIHTTMFALLLGAIIVLQWLIIKNK